MSSGRDIVLYRGSCNRRKHFFRLDGDFEKAMRKQPQCCQSSGFASKSDREKSLAASKKFSGKTGGNAIYLPEFCHDFRGGQCTVSTSLLV